MMKSLQNPCWAATLTFAVLACSVSIPADRELNMSFQLDRNQIVLDGLRVEGHRGRFVIGSADPSTLIGSAFATAHRLQLTKPFHLMIRDIHAETVAANVVDLGGEMDGIVGADVLGPVVVIDFQNRLVTRFSGSIEREPSRTHRWKGIPRYPLRIDGIETTGVVDTAIPDTLIVPSSMRGNRACERCEVDVEIAGLSFPDLLVRTAEIDEIRIGNRLLEHFLLTIDYRHGTTTLEQR